MSRASGHQKSSPAARRKARRFALQALYQWQVSGSGLGDIEAEFRTDNDMSKVDDEYFHDILHGVPKEKSVLDEKIQPFLDRRIDELTPVELAILRLGAFEMCHRIDVPYKVVINEAIELAKTFGATDGHKYVNGVLDKLAQRERMVEIRGGKG
ncbi:MULTISPECIES: transcription antitermination factor NusB [Thalassolituus]|jgi:N utilization substance protein B|uniref:transcription antitermination factor NusB n=1 Tax=Thalassolituus TaxID=187492 RepID=UPI0007CF54A4|nr:MULTISPECIES: transcription antitermination factor NusB [Thalassolituus]KZY95870.1 N utilization substance protein B [Oleibacter sp. HI0075]MEC9255503.1 transcription antitermination factor NusB [Pseudomonadota bacterium]HCG78207.1 transcription antitermination factor NusB [Oceanospirillales bacterium]MEE3161636.1 transcription antitermination factor NusB [Pseudomonadota bacterium]MEE3208689.1 transcription antitermination factor NusB [Pseudomonadota bacterium]|tara:strand:- start:576 stop:1037 length:462 start_codon:yes stop_codon:yes gene_type:complete